MPRRALPLIATFVLAACDVFLLPTDSPIGSPSPSPAPASPGETASPSPEPTVEASPEESPFVPALSVPAHARSLVDLLSVRTRPDTDASWVDAVDATTGELVTDSYRLSTGEFVRLVSGPLFNDGFAWYRVEPIRGLSEVSWQSGSGGVREGQGWVAGGADGTPWLEPADPPVTDPPATPRPAGLLELAFSGVGQGVTAAFLLDAPVQVEWDAADPSGEGCQLQVSLAPREGGSAYQVVSGAIGGLPQGDTWSAALPEGEYVVRVDGRCAWAVLVVERG